MIDLNTHIYLSRKKLSVDDMFQAAMLRMKRNITKKVEEEAVEEAKDENCDCAHGSKEELKKEVG